MDPIYFKPNVSDEPIRKPPENIKIFKKERHMEGKFAKMSENFGIPRKLLFSSFPEIPEDAVLFFTGNFRKFTNFSSNGKRPQFQNYFIYDVN